MKKFSVIVFLLNLNLKTMKAITILNLIFFVIFTNVYAQHSEHVIVNQMGYNLNEAKHFVCYTANEGTSFSIFPFENGEAKTTNKLFSGKIKNHSGDFTGFNPPNSLSEYVVNIEGVGYSFPFWIQEHLMEKLSSKLAYQFFIDVRGGYGIKTLPSNITGGGPSRDGGGQTLEALYEGLLYASNPALYDSWTNGLTGFYKMRAEYLSVDTFDYSTYNNNFMNVWDVKLQIPDLIKLILWHAEYCYNNMEFNGKAGGAYEENLDFDGVRQFGYAGTPLQSFDYQNMLDQLAAVCAFYPLFLNKYINEDQYQRYRKACLDRWELYERHKEVRYWVKSYKWIDEGYREFNEQGNAFGQGLFRNLMMYMSELTQPNGGQSAKFLKYAQDCASDIIKNWSFENPWHTWAMRNAEHITPQSLAFFYLTYPQLCPAGTKEKLQAYSDYIHKRTNNPWNYRTHNDTEWAHRKSKEIGTVCGLGGSLFAVSSATGDTKLRNVAWSQVNFVFGCNPANACLSYKSNARVALGGYWDGIECGWPHDFGWGAGELALCRGTMDGSPTNQAFPYQPDSAALADFPGVYGTEGWAVSNRAWMSTVALSTLGSHSVEVFDKNKKQISNAKNGETITIQLVAALNIKPTIIEKGYVMVMPKTGSKFKLILDETSENSGVFEATFVVDKKYGESIDFSYGYMAFKKNKSIIFSK